MASNTTGQFVIPAGGVALMNLPSGQTGSIMTFKARKANAAAVYVAGPQSPGIAVTPIEQHGFELDPGDDVQLTGAHWQTLYIKGTAGDVLGWFLTNL